MGALRHPEYRWFFAGTLCANVGQWMYLFVVGWLVVEIAVRSGQPERSALYLGLLGLARLVPALLFGMVGGVLADRLDRRRMLVWTRTLLALIVGALGALVLSGAATIPAVLALAATFAIVSAIDIPVRLTISPMLTPARDAFSAISLTRAAMQGSAILGPLVAGVLIGPLGIGWLLMVNAGVLLLSSLGSGRLRPLPPAGPGSAHPLDSLREAFRYVLDRPTLRGLLTANVVIAMFAGSYPQLLPAVAHDSLGVGPVELSWLVAGSGVGALIGSIVLTTMGSWSRPGRVLLVHAFGVGLALVVFGFQRSVAGAVLMTALLGWLSIVYMGGTGNMLQLSASNEFRGRIMGMQGTVFQSGVQFGTMTLGLVGSVVGISTAETIAGVLILFTALAMSRVDAIRNADRPVSGLAIPTAGEP